MHGGHGKGYNQLSEIQSWRQGAPQAMWLRYHSIVPPGMSAHATSAIATYRSLYARAEMLIAHHKHIGMMAHEIIRTAERAERIMHDLAMQNL